MHTPRGGRPVSVAPEEEDGAGQSVVTPFISTLSAGRHTRYSGIPTLHIPLIVTRSFTPAPQETSVPHGPFSPAAALPISSPTVSKLQPDTPVCPHMQLLCDTLPYTAQRLSPPPSHQRSPKRRSLGPTGPSTEEPTSKHESSSPPPALSLRLDADHSERPSYTDWSVSQHSTRCKDRVTPWREEPNRDWGQQESRPGVVREGRPGDRTPSPSPIHITLGQVVSEIMLPTMDSPDLPRTPVSSDSPRYAPPQSPALPPSAQQPREVVAQLLQEAEDSDEQEFKDDPLLNVLRQQRMGEGANQRGGLTVG
nr:proline-rich receptor-like protein kinase PERK10 [Oncorhynchus nerka]